MANSKTEIWGTFMRKVLIGAVMKLGVEMGNFASEEKNKPFHIESSIETFWGS